MRPFRSTSLFRSFVLLLVCVPPVAAENFVLVRGVPLIDDFEIGRHPVTNAEYKLFVDAAHYTPPQHWAGGVIPAGMDNYPVVFVNRYDVAAYTKWRTNREGRIYRLPTASEFDYAARGNAPKATYPWGEGTPEGQANYDADGTRAFPEWRRYLKPVESYRPNPLGLYDMSGNVWQMLETYPDPAIESYVYRIESPVELERTMAGGSWARGAYYLKCRVHGANQPGARLPDIGFRLVREPVGQTSFHRQPRRLIAANAGNGAVYVGWQSLPQDAADAGFHVYRSTRRDWAGQRITTAPILNSTNFLDPSPGKGRPYYRVRAVDADGKEGPPSEWVGIDPSPNRSSLIAVYEPTVKQGGIVPIFGDLDGDGVLDVVLKLDNGIREMSRDPGVPVEIEAFTSYGRSLWRRPLVYHDHCFGNANNVPVVVYDVDGDGKAEVIAMIQEGERLYLAILDGMTGRVRRKTPWTEMYSDFSKSSTRVHMAIAYLNGKTPAIVTQTGLYENEILDAYDAQLHHLWQYRSFGETSGSGSHRISVADVDGDGRDEVFDGTTLLNPDGTVRWSIYRGHPDIVSINHILPGSKDRQVFYGVETAVHAGAYLVDAKSGKTIWKLNCEDDPRWTHAHMGWVADIWAGSPGMEMLTNRDGHTAKDEVLFAADGKILMNPFPPGWQPVNWTGGKVRDLISSDGAMIGQFNGKDVVAAPSGVGGGKCVMTADLYGDFRDEMVCIVNHKVQVFSNIDPVERREVTRTESREYRLWLARNLGAGYGIYFEWEPE